jgi:hypothetical protein
VLGGGCRIKSGSKSLVLVPEMLAGAWLELGVGVSVGTELCIGCVSGPTVSCPREHSGTAMSVMTWPANCPSSHLHPPPSAPWKYCGLFVSPLSPSSCIQLNHQVKVLGRAVRWLGHGAEPTCMGLVPCNREPYRDHRPLLSGEGRARRHHL